MQVTPQVGLQHHCSITTEEVEVKVGEPPAEAGGAGGGGGRVPGVGSSPLSGQCVSRYLIY